MSYDLIIIGGGPAGVAAGVYAARKKLKILLIADNFGGQSIVSTGIENWIGSENVSGFQLAKMLEGHLRAQEGIDVRVPDKAVELKESGGEWEVKTEKGGNYSAKTIIVASGIRRKALGIPGEKEFGGKGVFNCSICDAPIFKNKKVAVVGGGNSGIESALDLDPYASEIYLLNRNPKLKGDQALQEKLEKSPKIKVISDSEAKEVLGDKFVRGLKYLNKKEGKMKELSVDGVFVEIGFFPNSELVKNLVELNDKGEIVIDRRTSATNREGIFAAGAVTDEVFKQNNVAAGEGVVAALSAHHYLINKQ